MAGGVPDSRLEAAYAHCAALVEGADPDRAVANLFADPAERRSLAALHAFDIETAGVRERVSQPIAGEIRLQWWRDTIERGGEGEGAPVAAALLDTIRRHDLPRDAFERLLEARIFDLYDDPMPSREAFEAYAGETVSTIVTLGAMCLRREAAPRVAGLAGHAGVALAAFGVARDDAALRARRQVFVPAEILAAVGLDAQTYLAGERSALAAEAMRAFAHDHAAPVIGGWGMIPRALRPVFLPLRTAMARADRPDAAPSRFDPLKRAALYWRAMRGRETA